MSMVCNKKKFMIGNIIIIGFGIATDIFFEEIRTMSYCLHENPSTYMLSKLHLFLHLEIDRQTDRHKDRQTDRQT